MLFLRFNTDTNTYSNRYNFFRKAHESTLPLLAPLAKKFLGVPSSSPSVERMFNISGHIFSSKRRRTGFKLFENLTFSKLNEQFV